MHDRERVIEEWEAVLSRDPLDAPWDLIDETLALLKEQEEQIKQLEHDLATTQNNLNYYVNGND